MAEVRICKLDAVPQEESRQFNAGELEILVIHSNGRYHCLAARCTHAGAPLAEGELSGDVLICPWHYSHFRISDGSVLRGPAEKPLKVYPVNSKGGYLFVET